MKDVNVSDGSCRLERRTGDGPSHHESPGTKDEIATNGRPGTMGGSVTARLTDLVWNESVDLLVTSSFDPLRLSGCGSVLQRRRTLDGERLIGRGGHSWNAPGRLTISGVPLIEPDPGAPCRVILRFGMGIGGDGKSNRETWRELAILDSNRVEGAGASGRGGGAVSPNRSIPESSDEEGDAGIPASATGMPSGSQPTPSNSSHTSEAFFKGKAWASSMSSLRA